jgi:protein-S-isoprenylcysteine O-methyltransferase Ste14
MSTDNSSGDCRLALGSTLLMWDLLRFPALTSVKHGATPFALDCYWSILLFVPLVAVIVVRIYGEEELLSRELSGYEE